MHHFENLRNKIQNEVLPTTYAEVVDADFLYLGQMLVFPPIARANVKLTGEVAMKRLLSALWLMSSLTAGTAWAQSYAPNETRATMVHRHRPYTKNEQTGVPLAFITDPWGRYIELNQRPSLVYLVPAQAQFVLRCGMTCANGPRLNLYSASCFVGRRHNLPTPNISDFGQETKVRAAKAFLD